jgi:uncharacterized protein with PQ loop repeat
MVSTLSNGLATIGTVCWCIQLIPQIIHNYRVKNTEGFPELMALLWCLCAPFFAVYMITTDASIPLMLQPHLFGVFCLIVYIQKMYYPPVSRPLRQIITRAGLFLLFEIALEVGCIIPLRRMYLDGTKKWPPLIFGIIAAIILAVGLIPPYFELWKRQGRVVGINFMFLLLDLSGAVFSLASVAVESDNMDIMGLVLYIVCAALETGIFVSHFIWLIRFKLFKTKKVEDLENDVTNDTESSLTNIETNIDYVDETTKNLDYDNTDSLNPEITKNTIFLNDDEKKEIRDNEIHSINDLTTFKTLS